MRNKTLPRPLLTVMMALVLGLAAFAVTGCGDDDDTAATPEATSETTMSKMDIVETASGNADLSTLVELVTAAELVETLQGAGPFTVFAPTNAAFEELPAETLETLQDPANKDQLAAILTYHVVPEELDAAAITKLAEDGETITTVQGEDLTPKVDGEKVTITDANGDTVTVVGADVKTSNGIVHVIDGVLQPKS
ncbi:MAG: fasciclin domain-containing protein [Thermoleophilaceae bacterium]|nr:fasciclin domain-containing protein [Thermoleophilaceae bacterium]